MDRLRNAFAWLPLALVLMGAAPPQDPAHRFGHDRIVVGIPSPHSVRGLMIEKDTGESGGFAVELTLAAAQAVGLEVEFFQGAFVEDLFPLLAAGTIDVICPLSVTDSRMAIVDFTGPILIARGAVFSLEDTPVRTSAADLAQATVTAAKGGVAHQWCLERNVPASIEKTGLAALAKVRSGEAQYLVTTQIFGRAMIEENHFSGLVDHPIDDERFSRAFALAVRKGERELVFDLNKGLAIVRDTGRWDELYERWVARYQPGPQRTYLTQGMVLWGAAILIFVMGLGLAGQWILRRRLARQATLLRQSESMYRTIAESLPALVYTYFVADDGARELRFASPQREEWGRLFPYMVPGADWHSYADRIHPNDLAAFTAAADRSRNEKLRFDVECRLLASDGQYRWLHTLVVPLAETGGTLWQGLLLDVSARYAAEEERQALEAQLFQLQKLEGLGVLAGGIAHDFNNLMGGVLGNVDLARTHLADPQRARGYLNAAVGATQRAAELTQQLLAYAGKANLTEGSISLDVLTKEMCSLLGSSLHTRATLHFEFAENLPAIVGDATLVRQVVMNLITNASDALGSEGGEIHVRTGVRYFEHDEIARSYVPTDIPSGDYVFLEIRDTGSGMTPEVLARMFDPFFTTKFAGRGLGLSVVFKTMQRHRGAVKVTSTPGQGTRFCLLFPPAPADATQVTAAPTSDAAPARTGKAAVRVLVIDDEPLVRDVAQSVLEDHGWSVVTAVDGEDGLRIQREQRAFDLVLLDLTMPGKSGAATKAEILRQAPATRVVLMSGFDAGAAQSAPDSPPGDFLQKPFTGARLVSALEAALRS